MSKKQVGFSVIEALIIIVVICGVGFAGYKVYKNHKPAATAKNSSSQATSLPAAAPGTTQAISNVVTQAINSSSSIDSQYTANDQSTAASSNGAASNLGGAYNESSF